MIKHHSRTPHGVRGSKLDSVTQNRLASWSHPARGAWIEMVKMEPYYKFSASHPARGAWIEIKQL